VLPADGKEEAMGMLRERMAEDLKLRGLAPKTAVNYLRSAQRFAHYYPGRSPRELGEREVKDFLLHMVNKEGIGPSTQGVYLSGIKFLYEVTLGRPEVVAGIRYPKRPRPLPDVLSGSEVQRLLTCITPIRPRLVCTVMYATGLRISEACNLKPDDIDARRGLMRVRQGKGRRDRQVPTGKKLLSVLREYWRITRPEGEYLFPGRVPSKPLTQKGVSGPLRPAAKAAGVRKHVTPHTFRHSYATHQLERGVSLRAIQVVLGHARIETTIRYTRMVSGHLAGLGSPLDVLGTPEGEALH
jgi:integrase/recombinase XerD